MTDSNKPTIGVNDFVRRQTEDSEFTHFEGTLERVAELARTHFAQAKPGYRDGVVLVPVPPEGFLTGVVELKEGDELVGRYEARREGEEPRKTVRVRPRKKVWIWRGPGHDNRIDTGKQRCLHVDVVLYSRETLQGNGEDCTGHDWDIVAVNGRITDEEAPIAPMTLIANHFELDGGTPTGMSPEEFESALRESVLYWKSRALLAR